MLELELLKLCSKYYSKKKFQHVVRVADYVYSATNSQYCYYVALAHDLLEDTECSYKELAKISFLIANDTLILTKKSNEDYLTYIDKVVSCGIPQVVQVKIADIMDHLNTQKKLKNKDKRKYLYALERLGNV